MNGASQTVLPLSGVRVLVTRAQSQAGALHDPLTALGAEVVLAPALRIVPCPTPDLDALLCARERFDWLVLTSANAVDALAARLTALGLTANDLQVARVAAIGASTARRLESHGFAVTLIPPVAVAEALADALIAAGVAGSRVLLPVAGAARDVLVPALTDAGAQVERVIMYDTVVDPAGATAVAQAVATGGIDVVTFASPSAVDGLAEVTPALRAVSIVVCIGPVTAERVRSDGWMHIVTAEEHSVAGLVAAVVRAVARDEQIQAHRREHAQLEWHGNAQAGEEGEHA